MESLTAHIKLAVGFFTRIPLPQDKASKASLSEAVVAFPVVGFLIGALAGTVWLVAAFLLPTLPAAGLTIAFALLLTGALHEDGLSDCADGLGGGTTRQKALDIMRDSRIGAYGAAALILSIGLRWASLAGFSPWQGFAVLVIAHVSARSAIAIALRYSTYARNEGLGKSVAEGTDGKSLLMVIAISLLVSLVFAGWHGFLASIAGFAIAALFLLWLEKRIGGYTGDGLGAMEQVCEITIFIAMAGLLA